MNQLDYDAIWNKAEEKARNEARLLYPDTLLELRRKAQAELALKYFRQMYYPQRGTP